MLGYRRAELILEAGYTFGRGISIKVPDLIVASIVSICGSSLATIGTWLPGRTKIAS